MVSIALVLIVAEPTFQFVSVTSAVVSIPTAVITIPAAIIVAAKLSFPHYENGWQKLVNEKVWPYPVWENLKQLCKWCISHYAVL